MKNYIILNLVLISLLRFDGFSQETKEKNSYEFTKKIELKHTPVKDQSKSGTCWSFATVSFIESELIRTGKGVYDLSEMYFVHHAYNDKADRYVRFHGAANFGPGGQAHDVLNIIVEHGLATQDEYPGLYKGENKHDHGELDAVLEGYLKALVSAKGGKLTPVWADGFEGILSAYLGSLPDKEALLASKDKNNSSSLSMGINPSDYVELTSYTHHPFYTSFQLEIPDNWSGGFYYNIPVDELIKVINYSLEKGFTVCWDGDVSDKGFSHSNGLAIIPEMQPVSSEGTEMSKWEKMTDKEKNELVYNFKEPRQEKNITQEMRQEAFNNYQATDDHLMHIVGKVKDQSNKDYFITKNSWSDKSNQFGGFLNMSEAFIRLNTVAIMVHKDAIPKEIREKLGF